LATETVRRDLDTPLPPPGTPGPFSLVDENILENSFIKCVSKIGNLTN